MASSKKHANEKCNQKPPEIMFRESRLYNFAIKNCTDRIIVNEKVYACWKTVAQSLETYAFPFVN